MGSRRATRIALSIAAYAITALAPILPPAKGEEIDTSQWKIYSGQPATAQTTGLAELTGSGLIHVNEQEGNGERGLIRAPFGQGMTFAVRPIASATGDVYRVWFAIRMTRAQGAVFAPSTSFRLHTVQGGTLRTTAYVRDDDPVSVPNGAFATGKGFSLHAQSNLATGQDVALVGTQWNSAMPVIAWDNWTRIEFEVVRGPQGRYVVSVNGTPMSGFVAMNTSSITAAQMAASMRVVLPPVAGVRYELGGPIGFSDLERAYDQSGRVFESGGSVYRLMSVPGSLAAPWSPFFASGSGVSYSIDAFVTGGISPDHRRLKMSGQVGGAGIISTVPLGEAPAGSSGWTSVVIRDVLVPSGAVAEIALEHPGAADLLLTVRDGAIWCGGQSVLPWNHLHRYAVCINAHVIGEEGERAMTLVDLSADTFAEQIVFSAALPPLGAPISEFGELSIAASFQQAGATVELGGVAICRRVDMLTVDSYVAAFANLSPPRLVAPSRLGRAFFSGCDVDLVSDRPLNVSEPAEAPMPLFCVARSGGRLSDFLAVSTAGASGCKGVRWVITCGFVNELSNQASDPYWVNTPERAALRAGSVAASLDILVANAIGGGNEVVVATPIATTGLSADPIKTLAFSLYNQQLRAMHSQHAPSGRFILADVDAALTPVEKIALFSLDGTHFSAAGDIAYGQAMVGMLVSPPHGQPSLDWFTVDGGAGTLFAGALALEGVIGQHDAGEASTVQTPWGVLSLVGGFFADDSPAPCFQVASGLEAASICSSGAATFDVAAFGVGPFSYQWRKDSVPLDVIANPTAATATLAITNAQAADAGRYDCVVTNDCGSVNGAQVQLMVDPSDLGAQGGIHARDGLRDNNDVVVFVNLYFEQQPAADVGRQGGLLGSDGLFDNNDFIVFIDLYFSGC